MCMHQVLTDVSSSIPVTQRTPASRNPTDAISDTVLIHLEELVTSSATIPYTYNSLPC